MYGLEFRLTDQNRLEKGEISLTDLAQSESSLAGARAELIAAQNELAKLEKDYTTQIENAFKEFQTKAQNYSSDAANQTDITNQARQKELESMQQNLQEFRESAAQELQKKQMDLMTPLLEKAKEAIEKVGKDQGFNYVIDSSPNGGVILANGKDLLEDVKKELGF